MRYISTWYFLPTDLNRVIWVNLIYPNSLFLVWMWLFIFLNGSDVLFVLGQDEPDLSLLKSLKTVVKWTFSDEGVGWTYG